MQITYDKATLLRNWMASDYIKYKTKQNDKLIRYDMIRKMISLYICYDMIR